MKKYQSNVSRSIYEMAEALYKHGDIDAAQMHEYDVDCLVPSAVPIRGASLGGSESRPSVPLSAASSAPAR